MVNQNTKALTERFFQNLDLIGGFNSNPKVAVAVSGGIDSMALLWLVWQWAQTKGGHLTTLTVDHRLREGSTEEARWVQHHCKYHDIHHDILTWDTPAQTGNILALAREARYRLLQDYCYQHEIPNLFIAHQADDQLETFILHLERGSGLRGLSSMPSLTYLPYGRLLRPLLMEWRKDLHLLLNEVGWKWLEDPTNTNLQYDRIKIRKVLADLNQAGLLSTSRWLKSITALGQSQGYFDQEIIVKMPDIVQVYDKGFAVIDSTKLRELSSSLAMDILAKIITHIGGDIYPPRWHQLEDLWDALSQEPLIKRITLGGCLIIGKKKQIFVCRELAAIAKNAIPAQDKDRFLWDNRFIIEGFKNLSYEGNLPFIAALEEKGWQKIISVDKTLKKLSYPREVVLALPAIWQKTKAGLDILLAVPHLFFKTSDKKMGLDQVTIEFKPQANLHRKRYLKLIASKSIKEKD